MLIDTYAWIEFFIGSKKGEKVREILEKGKIFTSIISLAEIAEWCLKNDKNTDYYTDIVKKYSIVLNLNEYISSFSGKVNFERKKKIEGWGMIDSLILATGLTYGLKILTGDKHFSDIENTLIL